MDDLSRFCCQNPDCSLYGRRDAGNLSVRDRYGKHDHIRLLYCQACKSRFSERKGTPLSHSCPPAEKAISVLEHLVEGNGVRQTETSLWPFPPGTREIPFGEMWSFVAKKQKSCNPDDPADDHKGDWGDFVAYDAESRLVLAVVPGARSIVNAEEIVQEAHDRTAGREETLLSSDELTETFLRCPPAWAIDGVWSRGAQVRGVNGAIIKPLSSIRAMCAPWRLAFFLIRGQYESRQAAIDPGSRSRGTRSGF